MFHSIEDAIEDFRAGKMVIVVDDEDRENEGDLVMAADLVTPEHINFMASYGRGLICTPITAALAQKLDLSLMVSSNSSQHDTAFTISVDALAGGTGISTKDRALTIKTLLDEKTIPSDLARPGHVFPLIAKNGGVLQRPGHTEAAIDLARLAGLRPAGVICEIMNEDGTMARVDDLIEFSKRFDLKLITIKDLIKHIENKFNSVSHQVSIDFPTEYGDFKLHLFLNKDHKEHVAITKGIGFHKEGPVLVRLHSECFTGDIFGSMRCDCGEQLRRSLQLIENQGKGIVLYMRQEGRGIGLVNKIKAYSLQDKGLDTIQANECLGFEADLRDYQDAAKILQFFKVSSIDLITNNPDKIDSLKKYGIDVNLRIPVEIPPNVVNSLYLKTKQEKMGHYLNSI